MRPGQLILLACASILVCVSASGPLRAAETTGWISAVDHESDLITLDDGQSFALPDDISSAFLNEGTRVRITYSKNAGRNTVSCVALLERSGQAGGLPSGRHGTEICSILPPDQAERPRLTPRERGIRNLQRN